MFWKYDDEEEKVVPRPSEDGYGSSDETGAEDRYQKRIATFMQEEKPVYKHHVWWLIHNCVAHPLIGFVPCKSTFDFHDWTSKKINGD